MDGKFGPRTVTACNNLPADALLDSLCEQATAYYQEIEAAKPEMKAWFKNWNARAKWKPVTA
jgi:lysozyme family protein